MTLNDFCVIVSAFGGSCTFCSCVVNFSVALCHISFLRMNLFHCVITAQCSFFKEKTTIAIHKIIYLAIPFHYLILNYHVPSRPCTQKHKEENICEAAAAGDSFVKVDVHTV